MKLDKEIPSNAIAEPVGGEGTRRRSFSHVMRQSVAQLIAFNGVISIALALVLWIMGLFGTSLLASRGTAFTSANVTSVLLSWQGALLVTAGIAMAALYVALDLFAHVYFCNGILEGQPGSFPSRAITAISQAIAAIPRFLSPSRLPTLVYIVLFAPIVGVGFSIGLTKDFYVPHFIMDVVDATPLYATAYGILMLVLGLVGALHFFTIHGVLIGGFDPGEARRQSRYIVCTNIPTLAKSALGYSLSERSSAWR